jgi:hypothetical protein
MMTAKNAVVNTNLISFGTAVIQEPSWKGLFSLPWNSEESWATGSLMTYEPLRFAGFNPSATAGFGTMLNTVYDRQAQSFWSLIALSFSGLAAQHVYATDWFSPAWSSNRPQNVWTAVWGTLLLSAVERYTPEESERCDIIELIENSLFQRDSENFVSPASLLRACAVGAVISAKVRENPHIYSAPGNRIILDYASGAGRFATVVTEEYIHLLGHFDTEFRELTIESAKYDLLEVKNWIESH